MDKCGITEGGPSAQDSHPANRHYYHQILRHSTVGDALNDGESAPHQYRKLRKGSKKCLECRILHIPCLWAGQKAQALSGGVPPEERCDYCENHNISHCNPVYYDAMTDTEIIASKTRRREPKDSVPRPIEIFRNNGVLCPSSIGAQPRHPENGGSQGYPTPASTGPDAKGESISPDNLKQFGSRMRARSVGLLSSHTTNWNQRPVEGYSKPTAVAPNLDNQESPPNTSRSSTRSVSNQRNEALYSPENRMKPLDESGRLEMETTAFVASTEWSSVMAEREVRGTGRKHKRSSSQEIEIDMSGGPTGSMSFREGDASTSSDCISKNVRSQSMISNSKRHKALPPEAAPGLRFLSDYSNQGSPSEVQQKLINGIHYLYEIGCRYSKKKDFLKAILTLSSAHSTLLSGGLDQSLLTLRKKIRREIGRVQRECSTETDTLGFEASSPISQNFFGMTVTHRILIKVVLGNDLVGMQSYINLGNFSAVDHIYRSNECSITPPENLVRPETVLLLAVQLGLLDMAELILDAGADPNLPGEGYMAPLHQAIYNLHPGMVVLLTEHPETNINQKVYLGLENENPKVVTPIQLLGIMREFKPTKVEEANRIELVLKPRVQELKGVEPFNTIVGPESVFYFKNYKDRY